MENTSLQIHDLTSSISYSHDFTKKKAKEAGAKLAKVLIEEGEVNLLEVTGNIIRLKEVLTNAESELKKSTEVFNSAISSESRNGVKYSVMNTGDRLDFERDPIYENLKMQLKDREDKLKQAYKSYQSGGQQIYTEGYDEETGELVTYQVPVVPIKTVGKQTVKIEY